MDDNTKELLDAGLRRNKLIEGLASLGLEPQQIFDTVEIGLFSKVEQYLSAAFEHYEIVASAIKQLKAMNYPAEALRNEDDVYYFDWEDGVCWNSALRLMHFSSDYKGQQLVAHPGDIIPKILMPLFNEAIEHKETQKIDQLSAAINFVIDEWLTSNEESEE